MRAGAVALVALVGGGVALLVAREASAATPAPSPGPAPSPTPKPPSATKAPSSSSGPSPAQNPNLPPMPPVPSGSATGTYDCYSDQNVRDECAAFAATFGTVTGSEPLWQLYFDQCMAQKCEPGAFTAGARAREILERALRRKAFARTGAQSAAPPRPEPPGYSGGQRTSPPRMAMRRSY